MTKHSLKYLSLSEVKNRIRGSSRPYKALSDIRNEIRSCDVEALFRWLHLIRHEGRGILYWQFPAIINDLHHPTLPKPLSPDKEVMWARNVLTVNASRLKEFLICEQKYETELCLGNYSNCLQLLTTIEAKFGFSLWLIENRIALLQLVEGLEKQKEYVKQIRNSKAEAIVSYIAFHISQRNEDTTTPARFIQSFENLTKSFRDIPRDFNDYILFRIVDRCPIDEAAIGNILLYESCSSLVDYFITFVTVGTMVLTEEKHLLNQLYLRELKKLYSVIPDYRIGRILFLNGLASWNEVNVIPSSLAGHDALLKGNFLAAVKLAESARSDDPCNGNNWLIEAEARAEIANFNERESRDLASRVIRLMTSLMVKADNINEAIIGLLKICLNFRSSSFAASIVAMVNRETGSDPLPSTSLELRSFIHSSRPPLLPLRHLPLGQREQYFKYYYDTFSEMRPTVAVLLRVNRGDLFQIPDSEISNEQLDWRINEQIQLEQLTIDGYYEAAIVAAQNLITTKHGRAVRIAARYISHALLHLGRIADLIDFIVSQTLSDRGSIHMMPLREAARRLEGYLPGALGSKLSTPVLLDLYSHYVDDQLDDLRSDAYEDFLLSNGFERPSQIESKLEQFDRAEVIYYLRFVCIASIMQVSTVYSSSRELEEERLAVIGILNKIDPVNSGIYEAEIRLITQNQMIQKCVRQVEQSKIFVDVDAVRRWAHKNLKETFNRYTALQKAGMGIEAIPLEQILKDLQAGVRPRQEFLELPKNEAGDLFIQIIRALLRESTLNPEYGLDCFLSIRIRHGTLSGQLRSPVEIEKIITQRTNDSSTYKTNDHWITRLRHLPLHVREAIDRRLAEFSRDYDSLIERIAKDLIQIRGDKKKEGLFTVAMDAFQIRYLGSFTKENTSFDEFLDHFFEFFWEIIKKCLRAVCDLIDTTLKGELTELFVSLERDMGHITDSSSTVDLNKAIRISQTRSQQALMHVKEWFQLSQPLSIPPLPFNTLVDIGLQPVMKIHHDFDPIVQIKTSEMPLIGGGLVAFADIFFIIFENIMRHSGVAGHPKVEISAAVFENRLQMTIVNEVAAGTLTDVVADKVSQIKASITQGVYHRNVTSEGGTGFLKLRKIIGSGKDGSAPPKLDFGFRGDGHFYVDLEYPILTNLPTEISSQEGEHTA